MVQSALFLWLLMASSTLGQYRQTYGYGSDVCCEEYCYMEDDQPYAFFGTKTAYKFVHGRRSNQHIVPRCRAIQFWSINRPGSTFPESDSIDRMRILEKIQNETVRNYKERGYYPDKGRMCMRDLDLFSMWRWNNSINVQNGGKLTSQGIEDLKFMARRYQTRFRELLGVPYNNFHYKFQYSDTDRTHDSYQAFIEGLFNTNVFQVHADVVPRDPILSQYQSCESWQRDVENNANALSEYYKFKERQEYKQLVRNVFQKLGFRYSLNETVIQDMYDMCRFEKSWNVNQPSTWCAAFTKDQLNLLEYAEDLKYYYTHGYGHEMNARLGCPPLRDLYERFERTMNGANNEPKATVYFSNLHTILLMMTSMGIAKDNMPLTSDNYYQQARRQWRTSLKMPFGANLAAVLYQCEQGERYRVMLFLNEEPIDLPECQVGLCDWPAFKTRVQQAVDHCDLEFCNKGISATKSSVLLLVTSVWTLLFFGSRSY